jgi:glycosyltransferase involved in cell wall biosynthesis
MFGQLNRFKGALVALGASARLSAQGVPHRLALHGPAAPTEPFAAEFAAALAAAPAARHHGAYEPAELPRLMAAADWVVMPSLWFENAPLVLLEAARHRRPVICSGIGGMAELVEHDGTGLHAPAGDAEALAETMAEAATTPGLWQRLAERIAPPRGLDALAAEHMDLYRAALSGRALRPTLRRHAA